MNEISISDMTDILRSRNNFVLISHTNPDGDTVGSVYAFYLMLKKMGKNVRCLCDKPVPQRIRFICGDVYDGDLTIRDGEYAIALDVASPNMLGKSLEQYADRIDLKIDHHSKNKSFAAYNYVDSSAAACGEIVFEIASALNVIDERIACAIYAAVSSDTGCFKYSNTTAKTHMIAAYLISLGARSAEINEALFDTIGINELNIYPLFLKNHKKYFDGRVIIIPVSRDDKKEYMLTDSDLDELSSLSRKPAGTCLGVVIKQVDNSDCEFKLSMRSRKQVDCSIIAASLGGGGHMRAAGATVKADSIQEATDMLLKALDKTLTFND